MTKTICTITRKDNTIIHEDIWTDKGRFQSPKKLFKNFKAEDCVEISWNYNDNGIGKKVNKVTKAKQPNVVPHAHDTHTKKKKEDAKQ